MASPPPEPRAREAVGAGRTATPSADPGSPAAAGAPGWAGRHLAAGSFGRRRRSSRSPFRAVLRRLGSGGTRGFHGFAGLHRLTAGRLVAPGWTVPDHGVRPAWPALLRRRWAEEGGEIWPSSAPSDDLPSAAAGPGAAVPDRLPPLAWAPEPGATARRSLTARGSATAGTTAWPAAVLARAAARSASVPAEVAQRSGEQPVEPAPRSDRPGGAPGSTVRAAALRAPSTVLTSTPSQPGGLAAATRLPRAVATDGPVVASAVDPRDLGVAPTGTSGGGGLAAAGPAPSGAVRATPPVVGREAPAARASVAPSPVTRPAGPASDPVTAWRSAVRDRPLETPRAFPARLAGWARAVSGRTAPRYTAGPATAAALRAAGALGASSGDVVHVPDLPTGAPDPSAPVEAHGVGRTLAHELAHLREPLGRMRFLAAPRTGSHTGHGHGAHHGTPDADERLAVQRAFGFTPPALPSLGSRPGSGGSSLSSLASSVSSLPSQVSGAATAAVAGVGGRAGDAVSGALGSAVGSASDRVSQLAGSQAGAVAQALGNTVAQRVDDAVDQAVDRAVGTVGQAATRATQAVSGAAAPALAAASSAVAAASGPLNAASGALGSALPTSGLGQITSFASPVADLPVGPGASVAALQAGRQAVTHALTEALGDAVPGGADGLSALGGALRGLAGGSSGGLGDALGAAAGAAAGGAGGALGQAAGGLLDQAGGAAGGLLNQAEGAFGAGASAVSGAAGAVGGLAQQASGLANQAAAGIEALQHALADHRIIDRIVEAVEQRVLEDVDRRGGRYRGAF